jgi:predicted transcriptional regulator YheO
MQPLVKAVGATVGQHCEVVLHDLRVPEHSIVAIANGRVTGRRVGGPVIGGPMKDVALKMLDSRVGDSTLSIGYTTHTRDGRELRSTSLTLRTPEGKPVLAFCINVDLSALTMARLLLEEFSKAEPVAEGSAKADETPQMEVAEVIEQMIREALQEGGKPAKFMDRSERLRAVRTMHEHGLFLIRGGVERAAAALGVSRFTLYGDLKEVRNS